MLLPSLILFKLKEEEAEEADEDESRRYGATIPQKARQGVRYYFYAVVSSHSFSDRSTVASKGASTDTVSV